MLKKILKFLGEVKLYYSPLTLKYYLFLVSSLRCYARGEFTPVEVFQLGMGSPFPSQENINKYVSHRKMSKIDRVLNPLSWHRLTLNKGMFYKFCEYSNLPIPDLYAIIFKNNASISYLNSSFIKREDLIKFISKELPNEFVIKPELGTVGFFIKIFAKTNRGIIDENGTIRTEREIIENIFNVKRFNSFIVQERLKNHQNISKIFPSEFLHTLRIITKLDISGQCKILHAHLNVATGHTAASQSSDLKISISLNKGSLEYGILIDKNRGGFKKVREHPQSGQKFEEFKMPLWEDVLALAEEAALKFLPLRTLGWDIAITEKGLKILETNNPYTPPNYFKPMDKFVKTLFDD
jgi:hypothetical protein